MATKTEPTLLERLQASRQIAFDKWEEFIAAREKVEEAFELRMASESKPTDAEVKAHAESRVAYRAQADLLEAEVKEWDLRIADQHKIEEARAAAAKANENKGGAVIGREPRTYERHGAVGEKGVSYYRDLAALLVPGVTFQGTNKSEAAERLARHAKELEVELPKRAKAKVENAQRQFEEAEGRGMRRDLPFNPFHRGQVDNPFEQRVEPNLTQGQGGYFVPPLWLVDEFIPGLRAHRIAAGLARQMDLPPGTDSINIPKLSTLTTVGYQQANNAGLPSQDWTDTSVQANVKTVGGYSDVAIQLLEQSPNRIVDEVVTMDLMAAYNTFLDQQVIAGDGVNASGLNGGHLLGIYPSTNWSSTTTVTYTNSTPAAWSFPAVLGAMASQIAKNRYDAQNFKIVLHGRRWFWYSTGLDANDRPLGETMGGGRFDINAALEAGLQAEGLVGTLPFLADAPVYIDDNIPTNDAGSGTGSGGSDDVAIAALWDDVWLFNGDLRTNVYNEILSATLGVRFQLYNYHALLVRYGQSLCVASGTGFAAPTGPTNYTSILF